MSEERVQRYAEAIDSILADEFLTGAVTSAVMAVVEAERDEEWRAFANRLFSADVALSRMKHQTERLVGKAEGVRLARSYAEESLRESNDSQA